MDDYHCQDYCDSKREPLLRGLVVMRKDMAYVQFILESYEGMVNVTAIDSRRGWLSVSIMPGFLGETNAAIKALAQDIPLREVDFDLMSEKEKANADADTHLDHEGIFEASWL